MEDKPPEQRQEHRRSDDLAQRFLSWISGLILIGICAIASQVFIFIPDKIAAQSEKYAMQLAMLSEKYALRSEMDALRNEITILRNEITRIATEQARRAFMFPKQLTQPNRGD